MSGEIPPPQLYWEREDLERRLGVPGSKYTGVNTFLALAIAAVLTLLYYALLLPFRDRPFPGMFIKDTWVKTSVPLIIVFLSSWALAILFIKWRKLSLQRKALTCSIVPEDTDFVLSPLTADDILEKLYVLADDPKRFLLLNRIERALSNLRNIGRVSDIDDILRSQAENDEAYSDSTYNLVRGFIWAIPVFGFIGTVLGLSSAMGDFESVLSVARDRQDVAQLTSALRQVTGGLSLAFQTTLIGLVAAVFIQLLLTALKGKEEMFLDECNEYCHRHIVSRLKTLPVDEDVQVEGAP